ncbi:phage head-tail joining protein [Nitrospirillum bahiense]|uniref:GpW protein n=1 Tax=Nitrospirillum amazonense TaxID=28077 RepID=A0A560F270_9PROT|nr:hypothetical protein [Nitrospirillum amazonense]TWB15605.1 hypothetical protein FBZ88_12958 [Nitrospirillum amazonense]
MALDTSKLDALVAAYTSGALRVETDGTSITYRSTAELASAIRITAKALGVPNPLGSAKPVRTVALIGRKGY